MGEEYKDIVKDYEDGQLVTMARKIRQMGVWKFVRILDVDMNICNVDRYCILRAYTIYHKDIEFSCGDTSE